MIYAASVFVYGHLNTFGKLNRTNWVHVFLLSVYSAVVTTVYLVVVHPVFHQVSYGILVLMITILPAIHIRRLGRLKENEVHIPHLKWLYWTGMLALLVG